MHRSLSALFLPAFSAVLALATAGAAAAQEPNTRAPKAVVEAFFDAFNRHDLNAVALLYASEARLISSDFCGVRFGPEGVAKTYRELFAALPDVQDEVHTYVVEGDRVVVQFTARSRTRRLALPILTILTVRDGLIHSDESYFNAGRDPCPG